MFLCLGSSRESWKTNCPLSMEMLIERATDVVSLARSVAQCWCGEEAKGKLWPHAGMLLFFLNF